jgi:hypothetical protein
MIILTDAGVKDLHEVAEVRQLAKKPKPKGPSPEELEEAEQGAVDPTHEKEISPKSASGCHNTITIAK